MSTYNVYWFFQENICMEKYQKAAHLTPHHRVYTRGQPAFLLITELRSRLLFSMPSRSRFKWPTGSNGPNENVRPNEMSPPDLDSNGLPKWKRGKNISFFFFKREKYFIVYHLFYVLFVDLFFICFIKFFNGFFLLFYCLCCFLFYCFLYFVLFLFYCFLSKGYVNVGKVFHCIPFVLFVLCFICWFIFCSIVFSQYVMYH